MKRKTAREILVDAFREVAGSKDVDKITVKDITENCGYSTATFYRHFRDKYDLIVWSYTQAVTATMKKVLHVILGNSDTSSAPSGHLPLKGKAWH